MKKTFLLLLAPVLCTGIATAQEAVTSSARPTPTPASSAGRTAETERVTVTGSAIEESETDTAASVTILNENNLKQSAAPSLGDTLGTQPGIAASGFAPGASRPVIRGLADNRVRV